jgi:hypothetical protein
MSCSTKTNWFKPCGTSKSGNGNQAAGPSTSRLVNKLGRIGEPAQSQVLDTLAEMFAA